MPGRAGGLRLDSDPVCATRRDESGDGLTTRTARRLPVMWDHTLGHWPVIDGCGSMWPMTAAVIRRFVARRHVDYGRVRSAICPAH